MGAPAGTPLCQCNDIFAAIIYPLPHSRGRGGGGEGGLAQSQRRQFGQGLQAVQNSASLAPFQPGKVTHRNQSVPSAPGPEHPKPLSPSPPGWAWHSPAGPGTPQPVPALAQPILSPGPLEKANLRFPGPPGAKPLPRPAEGCFGKLKDQGWRGQKGFCASPKAQPRAEGSAPGAFQSQRRVPRGAEPFPTPRPGNSLLLLPPASAAPSLPPAPRPLGPVSPPAL